MAPMESMSSMSSVPSMLPLSPNSFVLPTDSHRQVPSNAVYEGIRCVENLLNQHGGMLSFVSLRHMLYRIDYSFFGNLFDTFGGLQNFLCFFPNHFSVITVGDKVFVQLNQRKTGSQSPSLSNSDSIDTRDSNVFQKSKDYV